MGRPFPSLTVPIPSKEGKTNAKNPARSFDRAGFLEIKPGDTNFRAGRHEKEVTGDRDRGSEWLGSLAGTSVCVACSIEMRWPTTFGQRRGVSLRRNNRGVFGFKLVGGFVAERLVQPFGIVKRFDVPEHAQPGCYQVLKVLVLGPLVLNSWNESLDIGVPIRRPQRKPSWSHSRLGHYPVKTLLIDLVVIARHRVNFQFVGLGMLNKGVCPLFDPNFRRVARRRQDADFSCR